jgi:hypothetical protein
MVVLVGCPLVMAPAMLIVLAQLQRQHQSHSTIQVSRLALRRISPSGINRRFL